MQKDCTSCNEEREQARKEIEEITLILELQSKVVTALLCKIEDQISILKEYRLEEQIEKLQTGYSFIFEGNIKIELVKEELSEILKESKRRSDFT